MRFQVSQLLLVGLISFKLCNATTENLRRGGGSPGEQDNQNGNDVGRHDDEHRFLENVNIFDATVAQEDKVPTRFIVKYKSPEAMKRAKMKRNKKPAIMTLKSVDVEVLHLQSDAELKELEEDDNVAYVEIDPKRYLMDAIPHRDLQGGEETPYGIKMVEALSVPDELVANRKVCIIDTGYDATHPDLPSDNVSGDDNRGSKWDTDGNGHGTHVAGTIAAVGDNGYGVLGVNRNGELGLHIVRLFNDKGRPIFGSTLMGLAQQCVDAGSNVISMSLGGPIPIEVEREFFQTIFESNVLVVAAAGNSGNTANSYPASYDAVMSVAAVDENKELAFFSQRNDQVEISAPGVRVLSTKTGGGYIAYSGTSMACPHVAGVAALVWSHATDLSSAQIRAVLKASAEDLGTPGRDNSYGFGLVRADKAYEMLDGDFTFSPTATPTPEPQCNDFADFKNTRDRDCAWFEGGLLNRCSIWGGLYPDKDGVTGNKACCVCGGGEYSGIGSPTISPAPSPSPSIAPTQCVDNIEWKNSFGNGCEWYGAWRCFAWGDNFENDGLVADQACCQCK